MNKTDKELEDNLQKTFRQMDIAKQVYEYAFDLAEQLVDDKMPYADMIKESILPFTRRASILNRQEAISAVVANILTLSGELASSGELVV